MSGVISIEEFENSRVARFPDLKGSTMPMLDAFIPGCEREIFQIIGKGVGEDAAQEIPIADNRHFNVAVVHCEPGKGTLHHDHTTNEVFMPLQGTWKIFWGDDEEKTHVILNKWDVASCPPHVMRGFRNVGDEAGYLFVIVGGTDPGNVEWRGDVVANAADHGAVRGKDGNIKRSVAE